MVIDQDGTVKPISADMVNASRVRFGIREMKEAIVVEKPEPVVISIDPVKPDRIEAFLGNGAEVVQAYIKRHKAFAAVWDSFQPAQRKIVQAIAAAGERGANRASIARLTGLSPTSSNLGVKLDRLVGLAPLRRDGDAGLDLFYWTGGMKK